LPFLSTAFGYGGGFLDRARIPRAPPGMTPLRGSA
jgi:hypothetical protein